MGVQSTVHPVRRRRVRWRHRRNSRSDAPAARLPSIAAWAATGSWSCLHSARRPGRRPGCGSCDRWCRGSRPSCVHVGDRREISWPNSFSEAAPRSRSASVSATPGGPQRPVGLRGDRPTAGRWELRHRLQGGNRIYGPLLHDIRAVTGCRCQLVMRSLRCRRAAGDYRPRRPHVLSTGRTIGGAAPHAPGRTANRGRRDAAWEGR